MNISTEHQMIWLAPESCATQITKKILTNYHFSFAVPSEQDYDPKFQEKIHFHSNIIDKQYEDFQTILNVRNPYDLVFSFYVNNYLSSPLTKESKNVKEKFNNWVTKVFLNHGYYLFLHPFYKYKNFRFNKWRFDDEKKYNFVLRTETLFEDIIKLPFIKSESENIKNKIKNSIEYNGFLNRRHHSFNELYDFKSAQLVYHFFKPYFYKFEYSPFSFTQEKLSEQQKITFIHGFID